MLIILRLLILSVPYNWLNKQDSDKSNRKSLFHCTGFAIE